MSCLRNVKKKKKKEANYDINYIHDDFILTKAKQ